jgi:hypothetical protein
MKIKSEDRWAEKQFGAAQLNDVRRNRRLVAMAAAAAKRPSGRVSVVFDRDEERAGAYDFLENPAVRTDALAAVLFNATVEQARRDKCERVYVVIDGSSLTLTDEADSRGLGPIGSPNRVASGLQVMNALAVSDDGVTLGLIDQIYWRRDAVELMPKNERTARNQKRPFEDKECANFVRAAENAVGRLASAKIRACIVIDREADNADILFALGRLDCDFIIRSKWDRRVEKEDKPTLRESLENQPILALHDVEVGRVGRRAARTATVQIRSERVTFNIRKNGSTRESGRLSLTAVWVKEVGSTDKDALDWLLVTNLPVAAHEEATKIVDGYRKRWRVEEFHRTWKQGHCKVEETQLQSVEALTKWTTILAAVAVRIERLKLLARNTPDAPATIELSADEITVLKRDQASRGVTKKRVVPKKPTIAEATRWIAELGGWIDQKGNGPPGSTTIGRGLERLSHMTYALRLRKSAKSLKRTIRLESKGKP